MPRKQKKYHYIYKTTCTITNKYYIGMHSASELNDGYLGSGLILRRSVRKHGKDNHTLEVLHFCENKDDLPKKEAEIVNSILISDPLCMNLRLGGSGNYGGPGKTGWKMPPMTDEHRANLKAARNRRKPMSDDTRKKMSNSHKNLVRTDEHRENNRLAIMNSTKFQEKMKSPEHRELMSTKVKEVHEKRRQEGLPNVGGFLSMTTEQRSDSMTEEKKQKMAEARRNSEKWKESVKSK